jgi:hypothetical protein
MELIRNRSATYHVSLDTIREFEESILSDRSVSAAGPAMEALARSSFLAWRILNKYDFLLAGEIKHLFRAKPRDRRVLFSVLMAPNFRQCFPYFLGSAQKSVYLFDAWVKEHQTIGKFVTLFGVEHVFVSSREAAEILQAKIETSKFHWMPEGIRPGEYKQVPYDEKDIDVLAVGRRYGAYHDLVVADLEAAGRTYLYEKKKGEIVFPGRAEFIEGLARAKISVCVPSAITHPERSGAIETLTIRYLQSMASKCLVVGKAPKELVDLFGYPPVVEIDMDHASSQLQSILSNFGDYVPLIERNFNTVVSQHTWGHRWNAIKEILEHSPEP